MNTISAGSNAMIVPAMTMPQLVASCPLVNPLRPTCTTWRVFSRITINGQRYWFHI